MDYTSIVKDFFSASKSHSFNDFFETAYCLINTLKKQGFTCQSMSSELIDEISQGFLPEDIQEFYRIKFSNYLIYYLKFLIDLDYSGEIVENKDSVDDKIEKKPVKKVKKSVYDLNPSDFKPKEYDSEFLDLIGTMDEAVDEDN